MNESAPRHTDEYLAEMAVSPFVGIRRQASILKQLSDPAQRDEAASRMIGLVNRVGLRPSEALQDAVNQVRRGEPPYRTDVERGL